MKHLPLVLVLLAGLWLGWIALRAEEPTYSAPPSAAPAQLSGDLPQGCLVRSFAVEGMCCASCPKSLHAALVAIDGVREAAIDFDSGTASAVVDAEVPVERLLAVLNTEKYSAHALP